MRKSYNDWLVRAIRLGVTAVGAALLTGCAAGSSVAPSTSLEGTNWAMLSYIDANGQMKNALPDVQVTAVFKDGRVGGSDGCNRYFASYEVNGSQIKIGQAGSTMMACSPEEIMIQAAAFQAALASVSSFKIENEQLTLMNAQGQAVLVFKAGAKTEGLAALVGTSWRAMAINNGKQAVVSLLAGTEVTAVFGEGGKLSGSAGCNDYTASYTVQGETIQIGAPAATRKMCAEPQGVMEQEATYLAALLKASTFQANGDNLTLRDAEGAMLVQYARLK